MLKFIIKEASVLIAFILLGGILLLSFWISHGVNEGILADYKDPRISVSILPDNAEKFRAFVERDKNVIRYEIFNAITNKARLGDLYPELKNVISPLEARFFPTTAVITVKDAGIFMAALDKLPGLADRKILHEPPKRLSQFLGILTFVFGGLWVLTLVLVLYFNIERLALQQEARWSLMKMLGAKPMSLFFPLWMGQSARVFLASSSAVILAYLASQQIKVLFAWNWSSLPLSAWLLFFFTSLAVTSLISFLLFQIRYRKILLG